MILPSATLILKDGSSYKGKLFGAHSYVSGEVVFQTGMVGYPESLTDPSYCDQILVLTYPLIGNYGIPCDDKDNTSHIEKFFESYKLWPVALIVGSLTQDHHHWNSFISLDHWLKKHNIVGLYDVDTRHLTKILRNKGNMLGKIIPEQLELTEIGEFYDTNASNLVEKVSVKQPQKYDAIDKTLKSIPLKLLVVDFGLKNNQLRLLLSKHADIQLLPWNHLINEKYIKSYDGIFLSSGPGDPELCDIAIRNVKLILKHYNKPLFGICLGHQIMALAIGAQTYKMKYGNRGHNQPCILVEPQSTSQAPRVRSLDRVDQKCFITSQNHGYAVRGETLPPDWTELFVNANDHSNEGMIHQTKPFFS